ncbi:DNA gyrase subunit A [Rickettsia rhipicephali]|nr:DNA gyrase subunit A [Rickettsia rhipicephali]
MFYHFLLDSRFRGNDIGIRATMPRSNDIELVLPNHLIKLVVDIMITFKNVPLLAVYTKVRHNSLGAVARFYGCPAQLYNRYLK